MSGHSHAKTIKHQKELTNQKKGQAFSKVARSISIAVKEGGSTPETNLKLQQAIEMAKRFNMPKENVENAIKRGTGELTDAKLEEVSFEAYGPGGIAIIINGITDNTNRTLGEVKQTLSQNGGKLVGEGAVKWMFEKKGCIIVDLKSQNEDLNNKEKMELSSIEAGAQDILWNDDILDVYTKTDDLNIVKKNLEEKGIKIESTYLDLIAKEGVKPSEKDNESCQKLFDALDGLDDVQEIYSNLKM